MDHVWTCSMDPRLTPSAASLPFWKGLRSADVTVPHSTVPFANSDLLDFYYDVVGCSRFDLISEYLFNLHTSWIYTSEHIGRYGWKHDTDNPFHASRSKIFCLCKIVCGSYFQSGFGFNEWCFFSGSRDRLLWGFKFDAILPAKFERFWTCMMCFIIAIDYAFVFVYFCGPMFVFHLLA